MSLRLVTVEGLDGMIKNHVA